MMTKTFYSEDGEGFKIERNGRTMFVFASCEGKYEYTFCNGYGDCPDEIEFDRKSFDFWIDEVYDDDGNEVEIALTDKEKDELEAYLSEKLEDVAANLELELE